MSKDIQTMVQDIKLGLRQYERSQKQFNVNKKKNTDRYFFEIMNQKKAKYYEFIRQTQQESMARATSSNQLEFRVQLLKRHMKDNKNVVGTDLRIWTGSERQRNTVKFTKAGFPIRDYLREMREDRQTDLQEKIEEKMNKKAESPNEKRHQEHLEKMKKNSQ